MFPSNTPFFSVSSELFLLFVNSFRVFYESASRPVVDILIDLNSLGGLGEVGRDAILTFFPFFQYSLISVLFGTGLVLLVAYTLITWVLNLIT